MDGGDLEGGDEIGGQRRAEGGFRVGGRGGRGVREWGGNGGGSDGGGGGRTCIVYHDKVEGWWMLGG